MKCSHKLKEIKRDYYLDFCGYRVLKKTMYCEKCHKKFIKKYY